MLALRVIARFAPGLSERVGDPILAVLLGGMVGLGLGAAAEAGFVEDSRAWSSLIQSAAICSALLLIPSLARGDRSVFSGRWTRCLALSATLSVVALTLGGVIGARGLDIALDVPEALVGPVKVGAVSNLNGWTGDTTTFVSTLSLLTSWGLDKSHLDPSGFSTLLDVAFGLMWFGIAATFIGRRNQGGTGAPPERAPGAHSLTAVVVAVGMVGGLVVMWARSEERVLESLYFPALMVVFYIVTVALGFPLRQKYVDYDCKTLWRRATELALLTFGLSSGASIATIAVQDAWTTILALALCGVGAFVVLALTVLLQAVFLPGRLVLIASMCAVGGMATAPALAEQSDSSLVGPACFSILWCNTLSIPATCVYWVLFPL